MNNKIQQLWPLLISLGSLIGFGLMVLIVSRNDLLTFDKVIIKLVQGLEHPVLTQIMIFFTELGSSKIITIIGVLLLIFMFIVLRQRLELILIPLVFIGARMLNEFLKEFFVRERPDLNRLIEIGGYSFPSGHAMNAMAFYGIVTFLMSRQIKNRRGRTIFILSGSLFILMIGISRVYLGVHYPTDVIAGYFASGFLLALAIWIYFIFKEKRQKIKI